MIGFRSDGRLLGNIVVDLVEHIMIRIIFSTTSDVALMSTGVPGIPVHSKRYN